MSVSRWTRRDIIAVAGAVVIAAGCVRLGVWQLARLDERRVRNSQTEAMMRADPIPLRPAQPAPGRLTRVTVSGRPDYRYEIALTGRSHNGSPGVDIVTPLRLPGTDTAVLVNRGWVYSPDASEVEFTKWREPDSVSYSGYLDTLSRAPGSSSAGLTMRVLSHRQISAELPYPIAPYFVVALPEAIPDKATPVRLPLPSLDEGPHKSYAIQWFSFATIAIAGTLAYLVNSRRPRTDSY